MHDTAASDFDGAFYLTFIGNHSTIPDLYSKKKKNRNELLITNSKKIDIKRALIHLRRCAGKKTTVDLKNEFFRSV
jgi:hypothetical protein